jgi:hypothetical protein
MGGSTWIAVSVVHAEKANLNPGSAIRKEQELLHQIPEFKSQTNALPPKSSLTTTLINWSKYKDYFYANQQPNTATTNSIDTSHASYVAHPDEIAQFIPN